jgi:hypothetical protein
MKASKHARQWQRAIQKQVVKSDKQRRPKKKADQAMQAGVRLYPEPPFPRQHQARLGSEAELNPPHLYDAPFYSGSRKLAEKVALVNGGDSDKEAQDASKLALIHQ